MARALIVHKITLILLAVSPSQDSLPMHFIFAPFAYVTFSVGPSVLAPALQHILLKHARVEATVCETERALTIFLALAVGALVA